MSLINQFDFLLALQNEAYTEKQENEAKKGTKSFIERINEYIKKAKEDSIYDWKLKKQEAMDESTANDFECKLCFYIAEDIQVCKKCEATFCS